MLAEDIDEFEIAAGLVIPRAEHAQGRDEGNTRPLLPVKTAQWKNGLVGNGLKPPCGNRNAGFLRKRQGDDLPYDRVPFVSVVRKLCDCEMAVAVPDRSLGTGTAER